VEGRLLLDVVVRERAAVLQLLAGEDQTLLIWRDSLLILHTRQTRQSKNRRQRMLGSIQFDPRRIDAELLRTKRDGAHKMPRYAR
jgi:hypothetical protein